jgi:hypothetical protein
VFLLGSSSRCLDLSVLGVEAEELVGVELLDATAQALEIEPSGGLLFSHECVSPFSRVLHGLYLRTSMMVSGEDRRMQLEKRKLSFREDPFSAIE